MPANGSKKGRGKGRKEDEDGQKPRRIKPEVPEEEHAEEGPEEEASVQAEECAEAVPEEPEEAPVRTPKPPIAVLAEANGAGALAACVAVQNGHPPEAKAPEVQPQRVFCNLTVELGPDAIRCFLDKDGVQREMVKGVVLLAKDKSCRVSVGEVRFVRESSLGPNAKRFLGGLKKP